MPASKRLSLAGSDYKKSKSKLKDMISINFLPLEQKEKNKWQFINRFTFFYCFLFVALVAIFIIILFIFNYFLGLYRDDLKSQVDGFRQGKLAVQVADTEKKIKEENKEIEAILALSQKSAHWSVILEDIAENVPAGISISRVDLKEDGSIAVTGHADLREQLLGFKANLEKSKYITNVALPFSDLTSRTNIIFNLSFVLKEGALQGDKN